MSIFEKVDAEHRRNDIDLCKPVSQSDATGLSGVEPGPIEAKRSAFFADYSEEHSIPGQFAPMPNRSAALPLKSLEYPKTRKCELN